MWTIYNTRNTVKIPLDIAEEVAEEINKHVDFIFEEDEESIYGYDYAMGIHDKTKDYVHFFFDSDHFEHMDWLTHSKEICDIISSYDLSGEICFADFENEGKQTIWGVRFEKDGTYSKLTGHIQYTLKEED